MARTCPPRRALSVLLLGMTGLITLRITPAPAAEPEPIPLKPGPHLFLDDRLIERSTNLTRRIASPKRDLAAPVVTGPEDKNFQPYVSVLRDPDSKRFRMWYNVPIDAGNSHIAYLESEDGIKWIRPNRVLEDADQIQFGASVIDTRAQRTDPEKRYRLAWWHNGGLKIAASPDGFKWKMLAPGVVLTHNHDINSIAWDPIRNRYMALVSRYTTGPTWKGLRRHTLESTSDDMVHWSEPWPVITPDDTKDEGETQFYCMSGVIARGDTLIGMLKVLRDDLPANEGGPKAGLGYTALAWSHDGKTWTRDTKPFLDRSPDANAWDHAMSWADCQLPVGDEVFIYYGGYKQGHKVERFTERQVGLVRIKQDRYVSRDAGYAPGTLRTPLVTLSGKTLTVNADARDGEIKGQILDADGKPLPGFAYKDCKAVTGDSLAAPLKWKRGLDRLNGKPVRLELLLRSARLYALGLTP